MHDVVYTGVLIWMTALLAACVVETVRARSVLAKALALDTLALVMIAVLSLYAISEGVSYYVDAALMIALLSFVATIAAARYHSEGKIF